MLSMGVEPDKQLDLRLVGEQKTEPIIYSV